MNLDDESHLSSYLDDELDAADRLAVKWSVESSPPLADQLRRIALARDAVAGLDRPPIPRDLSSAVRGRIAADRRRARLRAWARPARVAIAVSGFTSIAASLIFALILLNQSLHETPDRPNLAAQGKQDPAPRTHSIAGMTPAPIPSAPETELVLDDPSPKTREVSHPEAHFAAHPAAPPGEVSERANRRVVAGILERPHVRRVVIVTDDIDAPKWVNELIRQDARPNPEFGRITICQEIVIDPERAEAAEVFAVPMDERGRRSFVERLHRIFPNLVEEGSASPELVTQLGEVGQVAIFRGAEAAPLGDPPVDLPVFIANREGARPLPIDERDRDLLGPVGPEGPGRLPHARPENAGGIVASKDATAGLDFVGPPDLDGMAPPRLGEQVTLLVWVTRTGRR